MAGEGGSVRLNGEANTGQARIGKKCPRVSVIGMKPVRFRGLRRSGQLLSAAATASGRDRPARLLVSPESFAQLLRARSWPPARPADGAGI